MKTKLIILLILTTMIHTNTVNAGKSISSLTFFSGLYCATRLDGHPLQYLT